MKAGAPLEAFDKRFETDENLLVLCKRKNRHLQACILTGEISPNVAHAVQAMNVLCIDTEPETIEIIEGAGHAVAPLSPRNSERF
jgi:hypothetical protein